MGGVIKKNTEFKDYINIDRKFIVKTKKCTCFCDNLVLSMQKKQLQKVTELKKLPELKSVNSSKLLRIYAIFDPKNTVWFNNIPKIITDSKISYFIPIDYKKGLVMISYTDESNSTYLMNLQKRYGKKYLIDFIVKECKKIFDIDIPKPIWFKSFYWENGVGHWIPNYNSYEVSKKIIKPFSNKKLFICGENYSRYQGWVEGGLESAKRVLKII